MAGISTRPPIASLGVVRLDSQTRFFLLLLAFVALRAGLETARDPWSPLLGLPVTLALAAVALVAFARGGRTARTALAGLLGLAALSSGLAVFAPRALVGGDAGVGGYTGIPATLAGAGLIVLAFWMALRGRSRRVKLLALPVGFVIVQWLVVPAINAGIVTNGPRSRVAAASTIGFAGARDVSFRASDGVGLRGWYVPGGNGAAVILLHGSHGDRSDTKRHLDLLSRLGYAVLAYDARGHGESGGTTNALGWNSDPDLRGAVAFLRRQGGVDPGRIAAVGISMGGEEALRAASDGVPLRAVVADGAGASTLGDSRITEHGPAAPIAYSTTWLAMRGDRAHHRRAGAAATAEHCPQNPRSRPARRLAARRRARDQPRLPNANRRPRDALARRRCRSHRGAATPPGRLPGTPRNVPGRRGRALIETEAQSSSTNIAWVRNAGSELPLIGDQYVR